jgi:hypothetical protein
LPCLPLTKVALEQEPPDAFACAVPPCRRLLPQHLHAVPAAAQSPDTLPEAWKLFESIPAPRLRDSLGLARTGVIAMDGEGSVRVRPDTARIRVGVGSEGASPNDLDRAPDTREAAR